MKTKPIFTPNAKWDHKHGINLWNTHSVTGLNLMNEFDYTISKICIVNGPDVDNIISKIDSSKFSNEIFTSFNLFNNIFFC